jgi:alpha-N-arabinofuranosidase
MKTRYFTLALLASSLISLSLNAQAPSLSVQVDHPTAQVSPNFYGLMTEEINFSYDGGVYPELVRDRTIGTGWQALAHWTMVARGDSAVKISVDEATGPSIALPRSIKVSVTAATETAPAGVQNDGFWGMAVRPNSTYVGSFYAKTDSNGLPVTVSLVNDETGAAAATATVAGLTGEWKQYSYTLKTGAVAASANNHLIFTVARPATLWLDLVSLFPPTFHDRPFGTRVDLIEKMAAMHPKFLRLPGGNYLEGNHVYERFDWKTTIGPWVDRPTHPSPWGYRSSDGLGFLEFLGWCEDLKIEPVLAVYAGYSMNQEHIDAGPALKPYIDDALDEIEYVIGGPETKWGAERIKNGHPAPFPLHYVEIGNEDWFDHSGSYEARFTQYFKAIKERYPQLQLIATAPVKSVRPDVLDEHFYMSAQESFTQASHYDKIDSLPTPETFGQSGHYDRADRKGPKIFVGEWATREGSPTPNLDAALGDAAWMTGMERNADLIIMSSYAPMLVNVNPGGMQWESDLIGYNALTSYGSPSYWAQVLFGSYLGTEAVPAVLANAGPRVFASATRDEKQRKLYVKVVNANSEERLLSIALEGVGTVQHEAKLITLSGKSPNATNSITHPDAVVPVESKIEVSGAKFERKLVPYSINVLELSY